MGLSVYERHGAVAQAFYEANRRIDNGRVDAATHTLHAASGTFPEDHLPSAGVKVRAFTSHAFSEDVIAWHSGPRWNLMTARYVGINYSQSFKGPTFESPEPAIWADYAVARAVVEYAAERLSEWPEDAPPGWHDKRLDGWPNLRRATPIEQRLKLRSVLSALVSLEAEQDRLIESWGPLEP